MNIKNFLLIIILSFLLLLLTVSGCGNGAPDKSAQTSSRPPETLETEGTTFTAGTTVIFTTTSGDGTATVSAAASSEAEESSVPEVTAEETQPASDEAENGIVKTAEALIGIPFAEGGTSPIDGFDNSGFLYYVLRQNGFVSFPRMISAQIEWGENKGYDELKPGDIAYYTSEIGGIAEFGGIYIGGGKMIYCPYPGEKVKTADITGNYWTSRFVTALSL